MIRPYIRHFNLSALQHLLHPLQINNKGITHVALPRHPLVTVAEAVEIVEEFHVDVVDYLPALSSLIRRAHQRLTTQIRVSPVSLALTFPRNAAHELTTGREEYAP